MSPRRTRVQEAKTHVNDENWTLIGGEPLQEDVDLAGGQGEEGMIGKEEGAEQEQAQPRNECNAYGAEDLSTRRKGSTTWTKS